MTNNNKINFATHQWQDVFILHATEDIELKDGRIVPKGYVNATQMCKANGKTWSNYWKTAKAQSFATTLESALLKGRGASVSVTDVFEIDLQGTWVHPLLAKHLAMWLSDDFALWAIVVIDAVINGEVKALTPAAEEAIKKLQEIWANLRNATKETFWFLTDSIKWYYEKNPRIEKYNGQNYSEVFDNLNVGLFGKESSTIKNELGLTKGKLNRDHFGTEALKRIEMIQRIAEAQIMHYKKCPVDAVKFAIAMLCYGIVDYKK